MAKNLDEKLLLRHFLIEGKINQAEAEKLSEKIRKACGITQSKRATWSNWITGKNAPNKWCKERINWVLKLEGYEPLYLLNI